MTMIKDPVASLSKAAADKPVASESGIAFSFKRIEVTTIKKPYNLHNVQFTSVNIF